MQIIQNRRCFLAGAAATGASGLLSYYEASLGGAAPRDYPHPHVGLS